MKKIFSIALFVCIATVVISCGGNGDSSSTTSTTSRGTFTATGMMSSPRSMPTANLLESGQVLVAVSVSTTTRGIDDAAPRYWRMRLTVTKDGDDAKVSKVEFVR